MKLFELFEIEAVVFEEESEQVDRIENFIIDTIVALQSQGIDKIYLKQLENELKQNDLELDQEFLIDFLGTLDAIDEVNPATGEVLFKTDQVRLNRVLSKDKEEKEKKDIGKKAMKSLGRKKKREKRTASKAGKELEL